VAVWAKVAALEELHNQEWVAIVLVDFEDGADVGMVKG